MSRKRNISTVGVKQKSEDPLTLLQRFQHQLQQRFLQRIEQLFLHNTIITPIGGDVRLRVTQR